MIGTGELREGMKVRTSDGHELGRIIRFDSSMILIEKGFFFPKDYEVPASLVIEIRDGEACLSATSDELTNGTWAGKIETTTGTTTREEASGYGKGESERHEGWQDTSGRRDEIDVPVMREEVHVERVPASASAKDTDLGPDAFKERTVTVPVREEEVEVTKRPRVREEVRVSKSANVQERRVEGERSDDTTERFARGERDIDRDDDRGILGKDRDRDDRGGGILGLGRDDER